MVVVCILQDSGRGYESEGCYYDRQSDGRRSLCENNYY